VTRLQGRFIVLERYFWGAATESLERYFWGAVSWSLTRGSCRVDCALNESQAKRFFKIYGKRY
jgi:hypothetical protein